MTPDPTSRPSPALRRRIAVAAAGLAAVLALAPLLLLFAVTHGAADGAVRGLLSARLGRPVRFERLRAGLAGGELRLGFTGLVLGEPPGFGRGNLAEMPRLDLRLRLAPLLLGRLEAPAISAFAPRLHLRRKGPGNDNWTFGKGGGASSFLGATRAFSVTEGRVDLDDPQRHLTLAGAVSNDPADPRWPLHLVGGGVLNGQPYTMTARGGPLNGRKPGAPHPFNALMVDGDTRVFMDGAAQRPFDFRNFDVRFQAKGPNLADLIYMFGLLAPNSPPFQLSARMRKSGHDLVMSELDGRVGGSDFAGEIRSDHDQPRRRIQARLTSKTLRAADLKALLASPPPHAAARSRPGVAPPGRTSPGRLFSQTPFSFDRLEKNDIALDYAAGEMTGGAAPLHDLKARLALTKGELVIAPVSFDLAPGRVDARLAVDFDARPARTRFGLTLRGAQVAALAHGKGGVRGVLDADVEAQGAGPSLAAAAADASGRASLRIGKGELPKLQASVLGGDLFGVLGAALGGGKGEAALRCVAADFAIRSGVMHATRFDIVTDHGRAEGRGRIDLASETVALRLQAAPGDGRAVALKTPVYVTGPLSHPKTAAKISPAGLDLGGLFQAVTRPFTGGEAPKSPAGAASSC